MNLDGDISPICLNILPLASSPSQKVLPCSTSYQGLCVLNFLNILNADVEILSAGLLLYKFFMLTSFYSLL